MTEIKFICATKFISSYEPVFHTVGASGIDLCADIPSAIEIRSSRFELISTGLAFEIPIGFEGQVRSRSGLAAKNGVFVLNGIGTIDSDYRGIISVVLANFSAVSFDVLPGMRIAQFVICQLAHVQFAKTATLNDTARGAGGFGSTGTE
jgi:dUTP pyrophosphatase